MRSLYVHVPFCAHKCHYCDFYSFVDTRDQQGGYVERLIAELRVLAPHARGEPLRTVFIGGGTPSLLRPDLWARVLAALRELFGFLPEGPGPDGLEFTVECNPESATRELFDQLRAGGATRISLGAQSFEPELLRALDRVHDPENVARALEAARAAGFERRSLDLIFAIPGQTLEAWARDLDAAVALGTPHVSCYNLTYEPGTALTARLHAGRVAPIGEELEADMFLLARERLARAGLHAYEVSNFARPGEACRHNLAYWRQEQWLAAGPSASGHLYASRDPRDGGWRWKNVPHLGEYLASTGPAPGVDIEEPDAGRAVRERIMTGLRLAEGLDGAAVCADAERAIPGSAARLERAARRLVSGGILRATDDRSFLCAGSEPEAPRSEAARGPRHPAPPVEAPGGGTDVSDNAYDAGARWVLTARGILVADHAAGELMRAVDAPG